MPRHGIEPHRTAHWEVELTNAVWMAVRLGVPPPEEGPVRLNLAKRLGIDSVATATLCQGALLRSISSGVAVYHTLFVELAVRLGYPLRNSTRPSSRAFRISRSGRGIWPRDKPSGAQFKVITSRWISLTASEA